jgi:hypothetical protein
VVVMLNLGNETEKPVIDARLRMSLADTIHVGTLGRRELAVPVAQRTEVALPSKQLLPSHPFANEANILTRACDKKINQHQGRKLV